MGTIQSIIIRGLMCNADYTKKVIPFLKDEYFDSSFKVLYKLYNDVYTKYNKVPKFEALTYLLEKSQLPEQIFNNAVESLETIYNERDEAIDYDWLFDETEAYCKDKAVTNALMKSVDIIDGKDKNLSKTAIPSILSEALATSFKDDLGLSFRDNIVERFEYYTSDDSRIKFPIDALNKLSNGGVKLKTLNAFIGLVNAGKSAILCWLAGCWMRMGYNVVYFTLEMDEESILERVDSNLIDTKTDDLKHLDQETFARKVKSVTDRTLGDLYVKQYPTSQANVNHFRHFLDELNQKKNKKVDVVIVDYINLMASSRYKAGSVNSYSYVKSIAEELRGLSVEYGNAAFFTATQVNRDNATSQNPDMTATSDSFGLPMSLDWYAALVVNEELMNLNQMTLLLLKTRYGNKKSAKAQVIGTDFDKMRFYDLDSAVNDDYDKVSTTEKNIKWD